MKEITISKEFVKQSNELLSKLSKDTTFEKKLLKAFNKGKEYIKESLDLGDNAQSAEAEYEKETKEAVEAKTGSEKRAEE